MSSLGHYSDGHGGGGLASVDKEVIKEIRANINYCKMKNLLNDVLSDMKYYTEMLNVLDKRRNEIIVTLYNDCGDLGRGLAKMLRGDLK